MKILKKSVVMLLVISMLITALPASVFADGLQIGTTLVENGFIKVTVDNATGRFSIRTVEGQPIRKKDQNVDMMFRGNDPETSFTTFRINGTDYIFGNPYKFSAAFFSEITKPVIIENKDGSKQVETVWSIEGVSIKQILKLYADSTDLKNAGNVNVRYEVTNNSGAEVQVGSRILLDTMLASNDGPAFQSGSISENPLTVERKLTHDPVNDQNIPEADKNYYKLPSYWSMKDTLDPTNPLATKVSAYGFNNFSEGGVNIVDEIIVGHWNKLANTKWDYKVNPNLDFTVDTNDYGSADSAIAFYWTPDKIGQNNVKTFETVYGLGEIVEPSSVFNIRYLDEVNQLETNDEQTKYLGDGVFQINIEAENLAAYHMTHTNVLGELSLQPGLDFVETSNGNVVYENGKPKITGERSRKITYQKQLTVEQIDRGEKADILLGEIVPFTFTVVANGKPWPTTKEYMFTATSPELEKKFANAEESVKALYKSSRASFIFLPPVGVAEQSFAYALSPDDCYYEDEKFITVNLSNIEAYNLGTKNSEGNYIKDTNNFNVYLKEKITGERYRVDVQKSVAFAVSGDGKVGDMRISYKNGDKVDDENNVIEENLGPTLPIGEYQVEIDFLESRVEGMDKEQADLYDIATEQTFIVSENEETRIRLANILAVGKSSRELTNTEFLEYKAIKEAMNYAAMAVDPEFKFENTLENTISTYDFYTFETEEEFEEFQAEQEELSDAEEDYVELLVTIRGMVKQVGNGENAEDYIVDTSTEPAVINNSVAYSGKDLFFERGKLNILGLDKLLSKSDIFNRLSVCGAGTLSIASSGFVFQEGDWSIDFFDGFEKVAEKEEEDSEGEESEGEEKEWAIGGIGDALNPLRAITIEDVYFNRKSLFADPSFSVAGFGLKFKDFILRPDEVAFGGEINLKIVSADVKNVYFDQEGFKGIESQLGFDLGAAMGLISPSEDGEEKEASGNITINHYRDGVEGKNSEYGIDFQAELAEMGISCELSFKKVDDGRILPDVIGFGTDLPEPGFPIAGATYITAIRGALRELADTIAGGDEEMPLTIEAGVDIGFGVEPANFEGEIDLTLKKSGIKLEGKLDYSGQDMLTHALIEARWLTPWFVKAEAEVDVLGWNVIIGNARMFIGQNLEKNRIDFEGFVSAALQIPGDVPVVGGFELGHVSLGLNNDKVWGDAGIGIGPIMISIGITYYWSGGIEIGTSGEGLPEGYTYLLVQDPENGKQRLIAIGEGIKTVASSFKTDDSSNQKIVYHSIGKGIQLIDNGNSSIGVGGVDVRDNGKTHIIPMGIIRNETRKSDAMLEVEYFGNEIPVLQLTNGVKTIPVVVGDINNPKKVSNANSFVQVSEIDGVTQKKLYVVVPHDDIAPNASWTLKSDEKIETKLLCVPQAAKLKNATMTVNDNQFTANVNAENVSNGDVVNLYLTKEKLGTKTENKNGVEIVEANDPGILIAKNLDISSGRLSKTIDLKAVELLGNIEDATALMEQGNYYLRAELKAANGYDAIVTDNTIKVVDEKAPNSVTEVTVKAVGNGYFQVGFKPSDKKIGQEKFEHSYCIDIFKEDGDELITYPNLGGIILTEKDIEKYWNNETKRYDGIKVGGWKQVSKIYKVYNDDGTPAMEADGVTQKTEERLAYAGLEVGNEYVIGISSITVPDAQTEPAQNTHFAENCISLKTLLPVPTKPVLKADVVKAMSGKESDSFITLVTNQISPTLEVSSDQPNVEVDVTCGDKDYGKYNLINTVSGSKGQISFDKFTTDGTYCIELKAKNTVTGDYSIKIVYLTIDTITPFMYLEKPITGDRTKDGKIRVKGTVAADTEFLAVNGIDIVVNKKGEFDSDINITSSEPTISLNFVATDKAGNKNSATVVVTNGDFKVPTALVLRKVPTLEVGQNAKIEAFLRMPNGINGYSEVAIPQENLEKLSFHNDLGNSVTVSNDGNLTATKSGANIINAEYMVSDHIALTSVIAVRVSDENTVPEDAFDLMLLYTKIVEGSHNKTELVVSNIAPTSNYELVYKVYDKGIDFKLPILNDDISSWSVLPNDHIVNAQAEQLVVVAKRRNNLAIGASNKATVVVEVPGKLAVTVGKIDNSFETTKATAKNQDLTQARLVYKMTSQAPAIGDVLDHTWNALPENGIINARNADKFVVAKIENDSNKVLLISSVLLAVSEGFGTVAATSIVISNGAQNTKINVPQVISGMEYVYTKATSQGLPSLYADISGYSILPTDGIIPASNNEKIIVAMRDITQKYAVGAKEITAQVWYQITGGGGGGGGGSVTTPKTESTTTVNNVKVNESIQNSKLNISISEDKTATGSENVLIKTTNSKATEFIYNISKALCEKLKENAKSVNVETSYVSIVAEGNILTGSESQIQISVKDNTTVKGVLGTVLNANKAIKIDVSGILLNEKQKLKASIKIPDGIEAKDITAVILVNEDGEYSPIPWKLNMVGNNAYVDTKIVDNGTILFVNNKSSFTDVLSSHWGINEVNEAAEKLFILGKDTTTFSPDHNITRTEFATIALRVSGLMSMKAENTQMSDVKPSDWYYKAMAIGENIGMVTGEGNNIMNPTGEVSRVEAMAMVGRILRINGITKQMSTDEMKKIIEAFKDSKDLPEWSYNDVALCIDSGIIKGSDNQLLPNVKLTRVECAAIANRLIHIILR